MDRAQSNAFGLLIGLAIAAVITGVVGYQVAEVQLEAIPSSNEEWCDHKLGEEWSALEDPDGLDRDDLSLECVSPGGDVREIKMVVNMSSTEAGI